MWDGVGIESEHAGDRVRRQHLVVGRLAFLLQDHELAQLLLDAGRGGVRKPDAVLGLALLDQGVVRQDLPDAPALGARLRSQGARCG
jgi:hypothetical protein